MQPCSSPYRNRFILFLSKQHYPPVPCQPPTSSETHHRIYLRTQFLPFQPSIHVLPNNPPLRFFRTDIIPLRTHHHNQLDPHSYKCAPPSIGETFSPSKLQCCHRNGCLLHLFCVAELSRVSPVECVDNGVDERCRVEDVKDQRITEVVTSEEAEV